MSASPPLRILHCPAMVGGNPQGLARAERSLGLMSHAVAFERTSYDYATDEILLTPGQHLRNEIRRWRFLVRAMRDYDIVHFNFGLGILPQWVPRRGMPPAPYPPVFYALYRLYARIFELRDLPLLARAGKGIFVTFQGDDARQGDVCRQRYPIHFAHEVEQGYYPPARDRHKRRRINTFARHAHRIYALNPDLLHVLPLGSGFMPYAHIDPRTLTPTPPPGTVPLVVHAPTHRGVKGTRHVLEAVRQLEQEGIPFTFRLIEGLSHRLALAEARKAHLLVDQVLAGWYGGIAVEYMALGRPVMAYVRDEDLGLIPSQMRAELPLINATPATLSDVLREWLTGRRDELAPRGAQCRTFVEHWHDPLTIATELKHAYESVAACVRG